MTTYLEFTTGNDMLDLTIENYLIHGLEPGGFATALLSNNLFLAASRADYQNRTNLADIALIVYHNMPPQSFGSLELVRDWLKNKDSRRTEYAERTKKEYTWKVLKGQTSVKISKEIPF